MGKFCTFKKVKIPGNQRTKSVAIVAYQQFLAYNIATTAWRFLLWAPLIATYCNCKKWLPVWRQVTSVDLLLCDKCALSLQAYTSNRISAKSTEQSCLLVYWRQVSVGEVAKSTNCPT